ncbi:flagellar basal body rod protein FlgB [uncultured Maricaulis sp.]|uniref:flagellar basal body rod protein FlgB n=1 Tax=uncultured Maricaulis sp. TaxID=174710 RepID=UPI0030D80706|tara:strand:+ start:82801 stop:83214 length:414 start_codon:yes stop_codon:yes gene_type:complete
MRPEDVPVLGLLTQSMNFHNQRQRVIAENVANANTPGYVAQDLDESEFQRNLRDQMQARSAARSTRGGPAVAALTSPIQQWQTKDAPDSETTVNGNTVVLEEQMIRANENRMEYESALSLYQKSLGMIRTAIRQAGR